MILSVIIVNYNAKFFLEQCLCSLSKALGFVEEKFPGQASEIILVDNHSSDGSPEFIKKRFPALMLITNDVNLGFAKANNQALSLSKGKYVLFLNPDTLIPEDSLTHCLSFLEENANSGAVGVTAASASPGQRYLLERKLETKEEERDA